MTIARSRRTARSSPFIFPAVGRAAIAAGATRVTETMFVTATALAGLAAADRQGHAGLLPPVDDLAAIAPRIAVEVAARAAAEGVASPDPPMS